MTVYKMNATASDLRLDTPYPTIIGNNIESLLDSAFYDAKRMLDPNDSNLYIDFVEDSDCDCVVFHLRLEVASLDLKSTFKSTKEYISDYTSTKDCVEHSVRCNINSCKSVELVSYQSEFDVEASSKVALVRALYTVSLRISIETNVCSSLNGPSRENNSF